MTYVLCVSCIFEITRSSMFMFLPLKLAKELDFSWNWIWCDGILIQFIKKNFFRIFLVFECCGKGHGEVSINYARCM